MHSLHCVVCILSTKQARRLQTGLRLRDRNATMMSGFVGRCTFSDLALVFFVISLVSFC